MLFLDAKLVFHINLKLSHFNWKTFYNFILQRRIVMPIFDTRTQYILHVDRTQTYFLPIVFLYFMPYRTKERKQIKKI